jgi:mono/diheme cytochrome c family protein
LLLIVAALAMALVGCGGDSATTTTTAVATTDTTASGGGDIDAAALYSANCASCHGVSGEGGIGPDLRGVTDTAIVETQVAAGAGSMPAFGDELSTDEISALATYVVDLQ